MGAAIGCRDGVVFLVNVSGTNLSLTMLMGGAVTESPPVRLLAGESTVALRLMTDVGAVEFFVAGGRAVASVGVYSNSTAVVAAAVLGGSSVALETAAGWRLASTEQEGGSAPKV